ncbi:hypothetical protein HMPREF0381_0118 [Lachnoanaerobaculum saburreum DSM 3986]|uniref:Uncharacterized protein n=1 Tax=Lachnoanaerobaculum saburreum DSM 3986 TaxID=887325 RepID=E6LJI3_9FIRM|nr:hypothetical protein HMPREF0381_0118 [Lachnoanaerobaculum saburreum DSM 3986]
MLRTCILPRYETNFRLFISSKNASETSSYLYVTLSSRYARRGALFF